MPPHRDCDRQNAHLQARRDRSPGYGDALCVTDSPVPPSEPDEPGLALLLLLILLAGGGGFLLAGVLLSPRRRLRVSWKSFVHAFTGLRYSLGSGQTKTWLGITLVPLLTGSVDIWPDAGAAFNDYPPLLAFAFGLAGSAVGSALTDAIDARRRNLPWLQLPWWGILVSLALLAWTYALFTTIQHRFARALAHCQAEKTCPAQALVDPTFTPITRAVFIASALLPIIIAAAPITHYIHRR